MWTHSHQDSSQEEKEAERYVIKVYLRSNQMFNSSSVAFLSVVVRNIRKK